MTQVLKQGARGEQVTALQTELVKLGFEVGVDGAFGPGTADAVGELQSLFGYDVDEMVGDATHRLIQQQAAGGFDVRRPDAVKQAIEKFGQNTKLTRILKPGTQGADVRFLQRRLLTLGYALKVDGRFGPDTEAAVRAVQQAFGYDVDGSVGQATHKLLNQQIGYGWNRTQAKGAQPNA